MQYRKFVNVDLYLYGSRFLQKHFSMRCDCHVVFQGGGCDDSSKGGETTPRGAKIKFLSPRKSNFLLQALFDRLKRLVYCTVNYIEMDE